MKSAECKVPRALRTFSSSTDVVAVLDYIGHFSKFVREQSGSPALLIRVGIAGARSRIGVNRCEAEVPDLIDYIVLMLMGGSYETRIEQTDGYRANGVTGDADGVRKKIRPSRQCRCPVRQTSRCGKLCVAGAGRETRAACPLPGPATGSGHSRCYLC